MTFFLPVIEISFKVGLAFHLLLIICSHVLWIRGPGPGNDAPSLISVERPDHSISLHFYLDPEFSRALHINLNGIFHAL